MLVLGLCLPPSALACCSERGLDPASFWMTECCILWSLAAVSLLLGDLGALPIDLLLVLSHPQSQRRSHSTNPRFLQQSENT